MAADDLNFDPDALNALLEEEGVAVDEHPADGIADGEEHGGELVEDEVVEGPAGKGAIRFGPSGGPAGAATGGRVTTGTGRAAARTGGTAGSAGTAGRGAGAVPGYARGTAVRPSAGAPAAARATGTAGTGGGAGVARATGGRSPSPAAGARGGAGGKPGEKKEEKEVPMIAGKQAMSSLPDYAGRADFIKAIEDCIVAPGTIKTTMEDVIGLTDAKRALEEAIFFPRAQAAAGLVVTMTPGLLLYGPPGTGKTFVAKAQANSADMTFFAVTASTLVSKWMGDSPKLVAALFDAAVYYAPSIVFIDEVDSMTTARDSGGGSSSEGMLQAKNELLIRMDGLTSDTTDPSKMVIVMGATNRPRSIDLAFRRRFAKRIFIPLPEESARVQLFKFGLKKAVTAPDVDHAELARRTPYYNCSDITSVCRDAAMAPLREVAARMKAEGVPVSQMVTYMTSNAVKPSPVTMVHLLDALRRIKSSAGGPGVEDDMRAWDREAGSE